MNNFQNRVAVVTGAGGGLGRALSERLADKGCNLALADINEQGLNETAELIRAKGRKVSTHIVDVSDREQMATFPEAVIREHGHVHVLINNAGVVYYGTLEEQTIDDFEWIVGINFWGVVLGCKFFIPYLKKENEAHIVNISSMLGFMGVPAQAAYCSTKFAVRGFSEALWAELSGSPVGLTIIHPGGMRTTILKTSRSAQHTEDKQKMIDIVDRFAISPEKAAKKIIRGIEKNKMRVRICAETYLLEWAKRLFPVLLHPVVAWSFRKMKKS